MSPRAPLFSRLLFLRVSRSVWCSSLPSRLPSGLPEESENIKPFLQASLLEKSIHLIFWNTKLTVRWKIAHKLQWALALVKRLREPNRCKEKIFWSLFHHLCLSPTRENITLYFMLCLVVLVNRCVACFIVSSRFTPYCFMARDYCSLPCEVQRRYPRHIQTG